MIGLPTIKELFNDLIDLPEEAREAHLDVRCGNDPALRERVEALVRAYQTAGALLADPTIGHDATPAPTATEFPGAGQAIGPYTLVERIGEGGFGEVWAAEQREPVRRRVAIKVIKAGMHSKEVLARFEVERQALALMDHPGIARVFDAGAVGARQARSTADAPALVEPTGNRSAVIPLAPSRPYFVMEHVAGLPITDYCDAGRLPIRRRLELFVQVCEAVQHAHTKGVIHRDLKPSNILVLPAEPGASGSRRCGTPKVIDFGIAKATTAPLTDRTLLTAAGRLMGTPAYMSPEQAGSGGVDVDTRSDVYSLGVILYQLLTGTLPFEPRSLSQANHAGLVKIIRELEPPKPSTRLWTLASEPVNRHSGATPQEIADRRDGDIGALRRQVRGDLDWIVMKCLEKDRTRRYETADALALEIERYLKNEPVLAGPPSRVYRVGKFVRRNRAVVATAAVLATALLAGMAGTTFGLLRAEEGRAEAEAAVNLLQNMFAPRDPYGARLENPTLGALIDNFVVTLPESVKGQPQLEGNVRTAVGLAYRAAGEIEKARSQLTRAVEVSREVFGPEHPKVAVRLHNLASTLGGSGDYVEAERLFREVLAIRRTVLGSEHLDVAAALWDMAYMLVNKGDVAAAEPLYREALDIYRTIRGNEHPDVANSLNSLAGLLVEKGDCAAAEPLYREALAIRLKLPGDDPSVVAQGPSGPEVFLGGEGDHAAQACATVWYRFEEGTANAAATGPGALTDFAGDSPHGTPLRDPVYRADAPAAIVQALGAPNRLSLELNCGQSAVFGLPFIFHREYGDATLEFFLKVPNQDHRSIFWTRAGNTDANRFNIAINANGGFGFDYRSPSGAIHVSDAALSLFFIPLDSWHHIAIVRSGVTYQFYLDGVFQTSRTDSSPDLPTSDKWSISGRSGYRLFGLIDEIRFSDCALLPSRFLIAQVDQADGPEPSP